MRRSDPAARARDGDAARAPGPRPRRSRGAGRSCRRTSRRPTRCSAGGPPAARARTACSRAATWPARRATTPRRPTGCASTASTPLREVDAPDGAAARACAGPGQNAQLIGGEVTLLEPDDHAARAAGDDPPRPQADVDVARRLRLRLPRARSRSTRATGEPRFDHLSFAGHFDSMMFGRRGIKRAASEADAATRYRAALLRDVRAPGARARRHALPRAQHDGHAAQHRPGPAGHPRLPRHGLSHVLLPARRVHRQRRPLEGRLPRVLHRRGVAADRGGRRRAAALRRRCRSATRAATARPTAPTPATATCRCSTRTTRATPASLEDFVAAFGGMDFVDGRAACAPRAAPAAWPATRARAAQRRAGWARRFVGRAGGLRAMRPRAPRRDHLRHARVHGRRQGAPAWELLQRGETSRRARDPRDPGAPAGLLLRDGAPETGRWCPPAPSTRCSTPGEPAPAGAAAARAVHAATR